MGGQLFVGWQAGRRLFLVEHFSFPVEAFRRAQLSDATERVGGERKSFRGPDLFS
jgi:hypothetical protein